MKKKAEIWVMHLQTKECHRLSAHHQETGLEQTCSQKELTLQTPDFWTSGLQN